MKYKISFREELKKTLFPLDNIRKALILLGVIAIIVTVISLIIMVSWYEDFPYNRPYFIPYIFITSILGLIVWVLTIVNVLCEHTLSRFFGKFKGEFERRFSYGFRVIVIGFIINVVYDFFEFIPSNIWFTSYMSGSFTHGLVGLSLITIYETGNILISLFILYGFLTLISAMKFYKRAEISPTARLEQVGAHRYTQVRRRGERLEGGK